MDGGSLLVALPACAKNPEQTALKQEVIFLYATNTTTKSLLPSLHSNMQKGPFHDQMTLRVGVVLRICHFNIEKISNAKSELLGSICRQKAIDVIAIQETHTVDNADLCKRVYKPVMYLLELFTISSMV